MRLGPLRHLPPPGPGEDAKPYGRRCAARDCEAPTSGRKPYCPGHVLLMPYVRQLPHMRAARGEAVMVDPDVRSEVRREARKHRPARSA